MNYVPELEIIADGIFTVYLLWASWQDKKGMQVVRYSHILGLSAIVLKICLQKHLVLSDWIEFILMFFGAYMTQFFAFRLKLYGLADVIVLFLCGIYFEVDKGISEALTAYFTVQAIAGVLLLVIQTVKGNIVGMVFRQPVPYIPYISVAFFLTKGVL